MIYKGEMIKVTATENFVDSLHMTDVKIAGYKTETCSQRAYSPERPLPWIFGHHSQSQSN